ncbi:hypothetical protein H0H81_012224 [Sphagnurus paluster]|uniref:Uncharacterized protein n=1 Tax=Sphagnurus paluster TaxID=117069 RepID=A0A9P7K734_9AGAR|nr:hypothetical protein H0H81_012224 [Sphagnurus paluster]
MLGFDFAIASIPLSSDENPPSPLFFDNSNTAVQYNGSWTAVTQNGVPNGTVSAPFRKTTEVGASVSLSFSGASAVVVKGPVSSESGLYSVSERKPDIAPTRPPPPPAPMVTSLDHSVHTAFDTRSIHTDTHSTTNLITGFGHQRMQSTASSEAGLSFSQASQMDPDPFARWDRSHQIAFRPPRAPTSDPTTPSSTSTRQRSIFRASMQRVASSSSSMAGSSRQGHIPVPDYIPLSPRKPLPNIPVPSYDAALRAPELTPQDVKDFSSFQFADEHAFEHEHAPPQYER